MNIPFVLSELMSLRLDAEERDKVEDMVLYYHDCNTLRPTQLRDLQSIALTYGVGLTN